MTTRREMLGLLGAAGAAALMPGAALAQNAPVQDLAVPGPLGDVWLGPEDVPADDH